MVSRKTAGAIQLGLPALLIGLFCVAGTAGDPESAARVRESAAEKFVAERLQIWQERLNLQDWDIRFQMLRSEKLEAKTLGNVKWDTDVKGAVIGVLSTYDYEVPYPEMLKDMEFTIVHELVHIKLASLPRSEASRRVEEHAVNELATALLKLAKH